MSLLIISLIKFMIILYPIFIGMLLITENEKAVITQSKKADKEREENVIDM